jgi:hypothetical protein
LPDGVKPDGVRLPRGGEEPPAEDWSGVHGTTVGVRGDFEAIALCRPQFREAVSSTKSTKAVAIFAAVKSRACEV